MKKYLVFFLLLTLTVGSAFATVGRIEGMGKSDRYMLDEMAMFTNPAYFLVYPNVLTGDLGKYNDDGWPYNLSQQWYGGWITIGNVSFGGAFNREDELETYLNQRRNLRYRVNFGEQRYLLFDTSWVRDTVAAADTGDARYTINSRRYIFDSIDHVILEDQIPAPVGETDLFLGYNLGNMGIGYHLFLCQQDSSFDDVRKAASGIMKNDLGLVLKLNDKDMVDVVLSLSRITYFSAVATNKGVPDLENAMWSYGVNARGYLTVASIGGQVIPSFKFSQIAIANDTSLNVSPGMGYQREIEGGSFWAGFDYSYTKDRDSEAGEVDTTITHGLGFSFGIEKQIAWPWFTLRVGGRKVTNSVEVRYGDKDKATKATVEKTTNPDNDRSSDDVIGAGFSFRVGERLHFDVAANERIPYSNLFNGTLENLATRISATYEF